MSNYKEVKKRKNLTSRVLQLQVNKFVSNKNNKVFPNSPPRTSFMNKNGFIEVLRGAIKSNDFETLEVTMPKEMDLSIKQNGGFSLFFWLHTCKPPKLKNPQSNCYIFRKGGTVDQFTPSLALRNNQTNLIIELSTSKSKKEVIYSNKTIEENHLYSVGITFDISYEFNINTEVSLYLDGKLDTQTSIPGEPIHNQGSVFFGKPDSSTHGFKGTVADLIMMPCPISESDIYNAHENGLKSLNDTRGSDLSMGKIFGEIFKRKKLIKKYAIYTQKPIYEIENLELSNAKMLEIVKNYDEEEVKNDIKEPPEEHNYTFEKMIDNLNYFFYNNDDHRLLCNKIDTNSQLINTCIFLANDGNEMIRISRVVKMFDTLEEVLMFTVSEEFLIHLAGLLNALYTEKHIKGIKTTKIHFLKIKKFFKNLQETLQKIDDDEKYRDEEEAKYMKKNNLNNLIQSKYETFKRIDKNDDRTTYTLEDTNTFGNCISEHENLLLSTQNIKNSIDIKQEE